jgi:hypothetical protein
MLDSLPALISGGTRLILGSNIRARRRHLMPYHRLKIPRRLVRF